MRNEIVDFFEAHPRIDFIQRCVRNFRNDKFVMDVVSMCKDPGWLHIQELGSLHPDKILFIARINDGDRGFCASLKVLLLSLLIAEKFGLTPVLATGEASIYALEDGTNFWELFYQQPAGISSEEAMHSKNVVFLSPNHTMASGFGSRKSLYLRDHAAIEKLGGMYAKYFRYNQNTSAQLEQGISAIFGEKKVLGVHVRGTDFHGNFSAHPKFVTPQEYLEETESLFSTGEYNAVFLATDEQPVLELFQNKFGDKLVYYQDTLRSTDGKAVHFTKSSRDNHLYLLGFEVLRDFVTLGHCTSLVAGLSNVSALAQIEKASRNDAYQVLRILDKGLNNNFRFFKGKR